LQNVGDISAAFTNRSDALICLQTKEETDFPVSYKV